MSVCLNWGRESVGHHLHVLTSSLTAPSAALVRVWACVSAVTGRDRGSGACFNLLWRSVSSALDHHPSAVLQAHTLTRDKLRFVYENNFESQTPGKERGFYEL